MTLYSNERRSVLSLLALLVQKHRYWRAAARYSVYLLYWYKSTDTDAARPQADVQKWAASSADTLRHKLLSYKSTDTDTACSQADVQEWATSSADTLRHKLLSHAFKPPSSKKGGGRSRSLGLETPQGTPGLLASGLRGSLGGGAPSIRNRAVTFEK